MRYLFLKFNLFNCPYKGAINLNLIYFLKTRVCAKNNEKNSDQTLSLATENSILRPRKQHSYEAKTA